jgi:hypothetical protein
LNLKIMCSTLNHLYSVVSGALSWLLEFGWSHYYDGKQQRKCGCYHITISFSRCRNAKSLNLFDNRKP